MSAKTGFNNTKIYVRQRRLSRRGAIATGVVAIITLAAAGGWVVGWWGPRAGPLASVAVSEIAVDFPLSDRQSGTWGNVLPGNPTSEPITILEVELAGARGLTVLGMAINDPESEGAVGTAFGYPPDGMDVSPVGGATLPPAGSDRPFRQLVVGVQRAGPGDGAIEAIRMTYEHDGSEYAITLPYSLRVFDPGA